MNRAIWRCRGFEAHICRLRPFQYQFRKSVTGRRSQAILRAELGRGPCQYGTQLANTPAPSWSPAKGKRRNNRPEQTLEWYCRRFPSWTSAVRIRSPAILARKRQGVTIVAPWRLLAPTLPPSKPCEIGPYRWPSCQSATPAACTANRGTTSCTKLVTSCARKRPESTQLVTDSREFSGPA